MIIVTGATGQLGRRTVEALLERMPASEVGVSVREPDRAADLAARGVRVRRGDFTDPASLEAAFDRAAQVLIVSPDVLGEAGVAASTAAIDAAYGAGAERVLYTSHQAAANPNSTFAPARDHAAVEAYLAQCGRPFVSLRNGYYASSLDFHIGGAAHAVQTGEIVAPADGPVSWTSRADLAEGAAAILAGTLADTYHVDGPTPPLTAGATFDLDQVAETLADVAGKPVRRVVVDDDEYVARLVAAGTPEPYAHMLLGSYHASRSGDFDVADPALESLLGREPQSIAAVLATTLAG